MVEARRLVKESQEAIRKLKEFVDDELPHQDIPINLEAMLDSMQYLLGYLACMGNNNIKKHKTSGKS